MVYSYPDKVKGVVVLDKYDYMECHLREGTYELQKFRGSNPIDNLQDHVRSALKSVCDEKLLSEEQKKKFMVSNSRMPRISGFPVVTTIDSSTSKISHFLVKKFRTYKKFESCSINNSYEL